MDARSIFQEGVKEIGNATVWSVEGDLRNDVLRFFPNKVELGSEVPGLFGIQARCFPGYQSLQTFYAGAGLKV